MSLSEYKEQKYFHCELLIESLREITRTEKIVMSSTSGYFPIVKVEELMKNKYPDMCIISYLNIIEISEEDYHILYANNSKFNSDSL